MMSSASENVSVTQESSTDNHLTDTQISQIESHRALIRICCYAALDMGPHQFEYETVAFQFPVMLTKSSISVLGDELYTVELSIKALKLMLSVQLATHQIRPCCYLEQQIKAGEIIIQALIKYQGFLLRNTPHN